MDDRWRFALTFVASQLVFVAAMLHLGIGLVEWFRVVRYGVLVPFQLRYPLFVLAGVAVIAGLVVAWRSPRRRQWYLAGFLTMLGFVFAYFLYHLSALEGYLLRGADPHTHEVSLRILLDHYFATSFTTIALTVELLAALLLGVLYVFDQE